MAIVRSLTGEYEDSIEYTAADLAGDWWWNELGYDAVIVDGSVGYETATASRDMTSVRLWRLDTSDGLHSIHRYVDPDTKMRLVKG